MKRVLFRPQAAKDLERLETRDRDLVEEAIERFATAGIGNVKTLTGVDIAKLRDYCLNPNHEDGKHKARVFASILGLGRSDAEFLRHRLIEAAAREPASVI
ncbi:MAG TPA: hypothetical protein VN841_23290 [Bryobacteraceae bacterium]|nr:hypothetical protein [Bryobacteraceae bacterium]